MLVSPPVVLGHRRLSILDLSSAGHQPMSSPDDRYWITFNGEIDNFKELATQLDLLITHSRWLQLFIDPVRLQPAERMDSSPAATRFARDATRYLEPLPERSAA